MRLAATKDTLMARFIRACRRFIADESSPAAVEYAVMLALIAVLLVVGARTIGNETKDVLEDMAKIITNF